MRLIAEKRNKQKSDHGDDREDGDDDGDVFYGFFGKHSYIHLQIAHANL